MHKLGDGNTLAEKVVLERTLNSRGSRFHRKPNGFMDSRRATTVWKILWWPLMVTQCSLSYLLSWMLSTCDFFLYYYWPIVVHCHPLTILGWFIQSGHFKEMHLTHVFPWTNIWFPKVWFRTLWLPALISNTMQHSFPLWLPLLRLKTVVTNCLVPIKRKRLKPNYLNTWHPTPLLAVPQSVSAPSTLSAGYHKQLPLHFTSHANISETAAVRSVPWAVGDWRDVTEAF